LTEYVVELEGDTVMFAVVSPVLHKYVSPPVATNEILSPSSISLSSPALASTLITST
jgi:hypothetical protein